MHSVDVRQVPISPFDAVHASLGNWTTENRARGSFKELFVGTAAAEAAKPRKWIGWKLMSLLLPIKMQRGVILISRGATTTAARSLIPIFRALLRSSTSSYFHLLVPPPPRKISPLTKTNGKGSMEIFATLYCCGQWAAYFHGGLRKKLNHYVCVYVWISNFGTCFICWIPQLLTERKQNSSQLSIFSKYCFRLLSS